MRWLNGIIDSMDMSLSKPRELVIPSKHLILCHPFSSHRQSFPASGSFPMSQFFESSGQGIGVSATTSVLPMNIQDLFPLGQTGWISLQSKDLSRVSPTPQFKSINSFVPSFLYSPNLTSLHDYLKKSIFDQMHLSGKIMSLLFNMLYRLVITFLPRSKPL